MINEYENLYSYCLDSIDNYKNLSTPFYLDDKKAANEINELMEKVYNEYMDSSYIKETTAFSKFQTRCFELLERELPGYFEFCNRYSQENLCKIAKKRQYSEEKTKEFVEINTFCDPIEHIENFIKEQLVEFLPSSYLRKNFGQDLKAVLSGKKETDDEIKLLSQLWDSRFRHYARKYREAHNIQNLKTTYNEGGDVYETLYGKYYKYVLNSLTKKALATLENSADKEKCNELFEYNSKIRNYVSTAAKNAFYDKMIQYAPTFECSIDGDDKKDNEVQNKQAVAANVEISIQKTVDLHKQLVLRERVEAKLRPILEIEEKPHRVLSYLDQVIVGGYEYICNNPKADKISYKPEKTLDKYKEVIGFTMKDDVQKDVNTVINNIIGCQLGDLEYKAIHARLNQEEQSAIVGDKTLSEYTTKANTIGQWRKRIAKMLEER